MFYCQCFLNPASLERNFCCFKKSKEMNQLRSSIILIIVLFLAGCAAPSKVMINPKTGHQIDCSTWGIGWLGTPVAIAAYQDCINKSRALGYIPMKDEELTGPPKFMASAIPPVSVMQPIWVEDSEWEYSVTGASDSQKHSFKVLKKDIFHEQTVYVVLNHGGKHLLFSETLGLCAILNQGAIEREYTPSLRPYDWPLSLKKSWTATGTMKTKNGTTKLATFYEITGYGKVKVPAGTFNAFYIVGKNDTHRLKIVELWYSPEVRNYVKGVTYSTGGRVTEELTSYKLSDYKVHSQQEENDSKFINAAGMSEKFVEQKDRIKSFLFLYCNIYESKDLQNFASLFTLDATENGKAFHDLLPTYRKNLEKVESLNYRIELVAYSPSMDTGNVRVKGKYFSQFLSEGKLKEKNGDISMELIENGNSYLVKRLEYAFRSKPQWKPWVEVREKK